MHFPKGHKLNKIFDRNTLKLSYSCTPSISSIIKQHNNKIVNKEENIEKRKCNCKIKDHCPLRGECLSSCIIYKAEVVTEGDKFTYYGTSEGEFKTRYNNHTKSFRNKKYENDTELSKLIWKLKDENVHFTLTWNIACRAFPYKCGTRRCDLCLSEKVCIIRAEKNGLLNKRTEFISKCRHRNKYILKNLQ